MENTAIEETVLDTIIEKVLTTTEETVLTEMIETCEESMKGVKTRIGKGVPKPLKPKSREEVTELTNDRHIEKINVKDINVPQNEGFMMAIQKQSRRERQKKPTTKSKRWKNHPKRSEGVPHPDL